MAKQDGFCLFGPIKDCDQSQDHRMHNVFASSLSNLRTQNNAPVVCDFSVINEETAASR